MRLMSRAALALAATLIAAPALSAQTSFSVSAGASLPIGDLADDVKMGYNATASLGIKPPLAPLGLRIDGMINGMDGKDGTLFAGESLRILGGTVNATLSGAAMVPMGYLIGGVGMYNTKSGDLDGETDVGFNIGAGINFPLTGFGTFLEARFHYINAEGDAIKFFPITFGIKF